LRAAAIADLGAALAALGVVEVIAPVVAMPALEQLLVPVLCAFALSRWLGDRLYRWHPQDTARSWRLRSVLRLGGVTGAILLLVLLPFLPPEDAALWAASWIPLAVVFQQGLFVVHGLLAAGELPRERVAVVGANGIARQVVTYLTAPEQAGQYDLIGIFDERASRHDDGLEVSGSLEDLRRMAKESPPDLVVLALPWQASGRMEELAEDVHAIPANVLVPMGASWLSLRRMEERQVGRLRCLLISRRPMTGFDGFLKRAEDVVVASLALLLMAPVLALVALLIRFDSPGPVLFRQTRLGYNGRPFTMYKFRSMVWDPRDTGQEGTRPADPRITRLGRFLRSSSLDEFPQFWNVLRGEMSVVGPRAHVPGMKVEGRSYEEAVDTYVARHKVKPGITGWAQINGMRGGLTEEAKARRSVELDLYYIENWSPWFDLQIIFRTILGGMAGRNVF
jgi:putative colanic acid biosynthesis UDP-glucose lipid carrier transferase